MSINLQTPSVDELSPAVHALKRWQYDGGPLHLRSRDLGWHSLHGAAATAAAIRAWSRNGEALAIGPLDGADLVRMAAAPDWHDDEALAHRFTADLDTPRRVLAPDGGTVEARGAERLTQLLLERNEPWTTFHRGLGPGTGARGAHRDDRDRPRRGVGRPPLVRVPRLTLQ